jgi:hypothetical protein
MRWAEMIGLEREYCQPGLDNAEWQLREVNGRFHRLPPKDDSYRSHDWAPFIPVDLPPFLDELIARQAASAGTRTRQCKAGHGGSGHLLFTGPDGGHYRRSDYSPLDPGPPSPATGPSRDRPRPGGRRLSTRRVAGRGGLCRRPADNRPP